MPAIDATSLFSAYAGTAASSSSTQMGSFADDDFMLLFLAQLRNQNPLEPLDNKDMMQQMLAINTLSEIQKLTTTLAAFGRTTQLMNSASMIGKTVAYPGADGGEMKAVVTSVAVMPGYVLLCLDNGEEIPLDLVTAIEDAPSAEEDVPAEEEPPVEGEDSPVETPEEDTTPDETPGEAVIPDPEPGG